MSEPRKIEWRETEDDKTLQLIVDGKHVGDIEAWKFDGEAKASWFPAWTIDAAGERQDVPGWSATMEDAERKLVAAVGIEEKEAETMCVQEDEPAGTAAVAAMPQQCRWCGVMHGPLCPQVKAIEFDETGLIVRRVEFHGPQPWNPNFLLTGDPKFTAAAAPDFTSFQTGVAQPAGI